MRIIHDRVAGEPVTISVAEVPEDMAGFRDFIRANKRGLAFDTETTGLDIYSKGFRLRLVQFGTVREAWVIPVEEFGGPDVATALRWLSSITIHNASFDVQVAERALGVTGDELWPRVVDSKILAHLVDSRKTMDGGPGTSLEDVTRHYIDAEVADRVKASMGLLAKEMKTTKAKLWATIPNNHHGYNLYAGFDPILCARAAAILLPKIPRSARPLIAFEHKLAEVCSAYQRTGFLLDQEYTEGYAKTLIETEDILRDKAESRFGLENPWSTQQVADAFERLGIHNFAPTANGSRQVDKAFLDGARKNQTPDVAALAETVIRIKEGRKIRKSWLESFLNGMDEHGRCHASINSLQARTARMSITGIPAQTLPANDWRVRRCFVADPEETLVGIDYKSQELRITASLARDPVMLEAFANDDNLHLLTARAAFGQDVEKDSKEYKAGKGSNFAVVFGGGWRAIVDQFGVEPDKAKLAVQAFWNTYKGVKTLADRVGNDARRTSRVVTPSGRVIMTDTHRPYAGLNYIIQETGRMVTARGLLRLHEAGYTSHVRLPIHDEVILSLPTSTVVADSKEAAHLLSEQFGPVFMDTDVEIGKRSWGSLLGADE
jgi:DNA polymerase I-like protein with 3'-5' exonuclease and polymerase domains